MLIAVQPLMQSLMPMLTLNGHAKAHTNAHASLDIASEMLMLAFPLAFL